MWVCYFKVPRFRVCRGLTCFFRSLLTPIGRHWSEHITPSRGKRKRRRTNKQAVAVEESDRSTKTFSKPLPLPLTGLREHLTIGFNTTTRHLEALAQGSTLNPRSESSNAKALTAVFVPRFDQPAILHSHLPLLTKAASLAPPSLPAIRLVTLPKGAEERLGVSLSIPRVGLIGLLDGLPEEASALLNLIQQHVPELKVSALAEAVTGAYLPVKIKAIQTTTPIEPKPNGQIGTNIEENED